MTDLAWFWPVYAVLLVGMLLCRCAPTFVLGKRQLSVRTTRALELIPAAAFAALVANDLCQPELWAQSLWTGAMPLITSAVVALCAVKTKSLALCAAVGVAVYLVLSVI